MKNDRREVSRFGTHAVTQITTPGAVILSCTCGWGRQESRRQNAFARAAKVRAAIARHRKETEDRCTI